MSVEQYEGRTIDIDAFATENGMIDETSSGQILTGIKKLAQRWTITFLNEPNTIFYDYHLRDIERGTSFMEDVRLGRIHTEMELRSRYALAELQAKQQLQAEESPTDPLDEKYVSAPLKRVEFEPGVARLYIEIRSQAGLTVDLILPIPIVV